MARPVKLTVNYFPHFTNHKRTLFVLQSKFGNDGYAAWFKTLELLCNSEGQMIDFNEPGTLEYAAAYCGVSEAVYLDILSTCSRLDAIDRKLWAVKVVWSDGLVDNLAPVYSKRSGESPEKPDVKSFRPENSLFDGVSDPKTQGVLDRDEGGRVHTHADCLDGFRRENPGSSGVSAPETQGEVGFGQKKYTKELEELEKDNSHTGDYLSAAPGKKRGRHGRQADRKAKYFADLDSFVDEALGDRETVEQWEAAYPALDIPVVVNQAISYAKSVYSTKRYSNFMRFVNNWLRRSQERAQNQGSGKGSRFSNNLISVEDINRG